MRRSLLMLLFVLGGCAAGNDCAVNAFELGQRDGVLNVNQAGPLAAQCSGFDEARYREGFADGFSRRGRVWAL